MTIVRMMQRNLQRRLGRASAVGCLVSMLGAAQYRLGNYNAAQVAIGQALSLDKSDALTYFLMGSTLARLGQNQAAERQFSEAARLDPRQPTRLNRRSAPNRAPTLIRRRYAIGDSISRRSIAATSAIGRMMLLLTEF